ncbi:capsule biosynthesis GfcC family protein, partial [Paraglaciecola sp.]|uniref:capsule biosynthesis GfcC family protein n=1 Tax=Paraglaciecola sp. TaxID=1920173 RepID=UPI003EF747D4
ALYKSENIQLNKTKSQLINKLSALIKHYKKDKPDVASSLRELKKSIQNWQLARKLTTKIDYDLARIVKSANSRIPAGKYILTITPRQKTVKIFGAIHKEINVAHLPHADASEYIQSHVRSELADKDYVIIIQADGRIIKSPVAYWNKTHQEVMPGSQIFIPFKPALFNSDFDLINQKLLLLASNRVL